MLAPFDSYYGGKPAIRLVFRIVPNATTRLLEARSGGLDLLQNAVPPYSVKFLAREQGIRVIEKPGSSYQYLGFNLEDPIVSDVRVRRAVAHAVDRRALIQHVLEGQARPATSLFSPEHPAYAPKRPSTITTRKRQAPPGRGGLPRSRRRRPRRAPPPLLQDLQRQDGQGDGAGDRRSARQVGVGWRCGRSSGEHSSAT